jgi:hypothetical protein
LLTIITLQSQFSSEWRRKKAIVGQLFAAADDEVGRGAVGSADKAEVPVQSRAIASAVADWPLKSAGSNVEMETLKIFLVTNNIKLSDVGKSE